MLYQFFDVMNQKEKKVKKNSKNKKIPIDLNFWAK